jgi:hypothetical protein
MGDWCPTIAELRVWQKEKEGCSVPNGALHAHRPSMIQNNVLHDRQTQAGAAAFARAGFIHAVKALKDSRQMF